MRGTLRRGMQGLLPSHHAPAHTEFPTVPNGARAFSLVLRNNRAVRAIASLDQGRVAEAFFGGDFDIQGDMLSALRLRGVLTDQRSMMTIRRFIQPLLLGQTRLNKRAISTHYDRDPSFFLQFLDPDVPLYTQGLYRSEEHT